MRKLLLFFLILSVVAPLSFPQNTRKDDVALSNVNGFLQGIPNASIRVCQNGATGIPCSPLATIFSSASGGALTNPFNADGNGNYFFYAPAANYVIQVTSPFGPIYTQNDVTLPNLPSVVTTTFVFQSVSFSSTAVFPFVSNSMFKMVLTGNVTSSSVTGTPGPGAFSSFSICQDGVGGHTFTMPTNFILPPNFIFLTGAGQCNNFTALFDGTSWQVISGGGGSSVVPASPAFSLQKANALLNGLSASGVTDNGTLVSFGEDSSYIGPNPSVYITSYAARSSNPNVTPYSTGLTATCTSGNNQVPISSASTFVNGDGVVLYGCGNAPTMSTPSAPTVSPALALIGTRTGIVTTANALTGSTTYNYKVFWQDKAGGLTAASPVTTITNGVAALGSQSVNITSDARTNDSVTYTTSSTHGFNPGCSSSCGEVFISPANGLTDNSFRGWYIVTSVADGTHFTTSQTPLDTRQGAPASATGGSATWYSANHLVFASETGGWLPYICSDRANPGTYVLVGKGMPQGAVNTDLTFDDFGSPMNDNWNYPVYVTNAACNASSPTSDNLATTITAGGGTTTLTLAQAPGTTPGSATTIRLDAAAGILAAAQAISANGAHGGTLVIPATTGSNQFVVNSFLDLTPYNIVIDVHGGLYLNETLSTKARIYGDRSPQYGNQNAAGTWQGNSVITIDRAYPGVYNSQQFGTLLQSVSLSAVGATINGALLALYEGGFNMVFIGDNFITSTSSGDHEGIALYLRGSNGQSATNIIIDRTLFSGGGNGADGVNHTPLFYCNNCGQGIIRSAYYLHRATVINENPVGGFWKIEHSYINGGIHPLYTIGGSILWGASLGQITLDTFAHPCLADFSGSVGVVSFPQGPCGPANSAPGITGFRTPVLGASSFITNPQQQNGFNQNRDTSGVICQPGANDGIFGLNSHPYCVNANNVALATGVNYPIFVNGIPPAAPGGSVNAGGSVATGTYGFALVPIWQNGGEGSYSPPSIFTATTGNQTIALTWPNPAVPGNPKGYNLYFCNATATGCSSGYAQSTTFSNPQSATSTGITLSTPLNTGSGASNGSSITTGGPTMLAPGTQGFFAPAYGIDDASGFVSTLATASLSASRTHTFPNNTGTVAELNLSQTWTANQFIANGSAIRFFSPNGVNWTALTGPGTNPASNVTFQLPSADSTGVQCLSSNGAGVLAFSACSGGTGTPGGVNKNLQYDSSGSFGGASNLNYTAATGVLDASQLANGNETVTGHRFTDSSPTGNLLHFQNAALSTDLLKLDVSGNLSAVSFISLTANPAATGVVRLANADSIGFRNSANSGDCLLGITNPGNSLVASCAGGFSAQTFQSSNGNQSLTGTVRFNTTDALNFRNNLNSADVNGISKNSSDVVILGGAAGINASSLTLTSPLAIAQGGTGQITASAAFNALAPATATGGLILGTGTNTYGNLAIGTNGLCLVSNGTTATWNSCASGAVGGSGTAQQIAFWSASSSIAGSPNFTFNSNIFQVTQTSNGTDTVYLKRSTDTSPTGNFLHFQNAAASTDIAKVDVNGNLSVAGSMSVNNSTVAGNVNLNQGPAPALIANFISLIAPTAVSASGEMFTFPGTASTGFIRWTNNANILTGAFAPASGIGACVNTVVTATNDNSVPTCNPVTGPMFGTQAANQVWASPNGSSGFMTVRSLVSGDIPTINLNLGGNGGVTGTLPIPNGGTNGTTALSAFNNLSPLTTAGDILYGGAAGSGTRLAAGTATQVLHSGATPSWSAVALTTDVSGVLPIANGGTNATGSNISSTNGAVYFDGTRLVTTATGGAGTLCLTSANGGTPVFGSCSGSAATAWSSLTNPASNLSLSMGANTTTFTWGAATGSGVDMFKITDTASNTGTGFALNINLASGSAAKPFQAAVNGVGVSVSNAGVLAGVGGGKITADTLNLSVNTSSPLSGGGALTSTLTLNCPTCVTSGSSLGNNAVVIGSGGGQGSATIGTGSANQVLASNGSSAPAFVDSREVHRFPAANQVGGTAGSGFSLGSCTVATRSGTNVITGVVVCGTSQTFQIQDTIPLDWDSGSNPFIRLFVTQGANATSGQTIAFQVQGACGTTDDSSFQTAQNLSNATTTTTANQQYQQTVQANSTTMTSCSAGAPMNWLITAGTAPAGGSPNVQAISISWPTRPVLQAN